MAGRGLALDLSPLRDLRDFRLLFSSGLITGLGSFATYVSMPFQIAEITGSYVAVGVLGAVEIVPLIVFGLWGGVLADRLDRKRVVVATEIAMAVLVVVLFVNSRADSPKAWPVYVVALLFAACVGLQRQSLDAILPRVVPAERVSSALALGSLRGNTAHV
ncbi:MAG: MFS transporter, partial [Ilumatobacteraceae bacterium]